MTNMDHSEAEENAWLKFVEAEIAHKGHGQNGQGSPITSIVLDFHSSKYDALFKSLHPDSVTPDKNEESK